MMPPIPVALIAAEVPADAQPIQALIERTRDSVRVRLIGSARRSVDATYTLTITAGSNRTKQGGNAHLVPGISVTLLDLTQSTAAQWGGVLDVQIAGGRGYRMVLGDVF
ncbi:curli-like amyloid fiber formation chaperone CsgH [Sphingomonas sp. R86521]|uniref:curli-like amyloid fiber formation chaperone CsgH n=1 Tax=Sphingomonas sp. R86521 TaxID=3093860 RepID=UPI0036D2EC55